MILFDENISYHMRVWKKFNNQDRKFKYKRAMNMIR